MKKTINGTVLFISSFSIQENRTVPFLLFIEKLFLMHCLGKLKKLF